jgi:hypothetical protein
MSSSSHFSTNKPDASTPFHVPCVLTTIIQQFISFLFTNQKPNEKELNEQSAMAKEEEAERAEKRERKNHY